LAIELAYIEKNIGYEKIEKAKKISAMIYGVIKVRKNKPSLNPLTL